MSIKNTPFDQSRFDNSQLGGDYYREIAERELIPRIIERNKQVLNVVPEFWQFYQRSHVGRRCSCWSGPETMPSSQCNVCYGTGNTAGYQKYGHATDVFDVTAESSSVNVVVDYDSISRPLMFRLAKSALRGYVDFTVKAQGGLNVCSLVSLHASAKRGGLVRAGIKLFSESEFTPLSAEAVTARLPDAQQQGGLHLRVSLERVSRATPTPRFSHVRLRVQTLRDDRVRADSPRSSTANRVSEYGFFADKASKSLFLDNTLRMVTSEDLFRECASNRLWKVVDLTPNQPGGWLTSWDVNVRLVQDSDRYALLP
jgi:hypothetical protein